MSSAKHFARAGRVALALALAAAAAAACGGNQSKPASPPPPHSNSGVLTIGVATDVPGFGTLETGSNSRSGFDIDLARWIANRRGASLALVDLTAAQRIPALQSGQVQAVIWTLSIDDSRLSDISFAGPYLITREGFLVRAGDTRLQTLDELAGLNVCAVRGTLSDVQLAPLSSQKHFTVTEEDGFSQCLHDLDDLKTVDAISTDQLILDAMATADANHPVVVPNLTFGVEYRYGIGVPKGNTADCERFAGDVQAFITSGAWKQFFGQDFPGVTVADHQPDPASLDPCA